jgi:uncharacterized protein (TIGR01244 family)
MSADPVTPAGIVNFTRVDAAVACGGATEPSALEALAGQGFASVVNLRLAEEPGVAQEAGVVAASGMAYHHLPMHPNAPEPATVDQFLEIVADPANQPVYIHCASASRVGAVWAIKRVVQDGWSREQAVGEARAIGLRSPVLLDFVHRYLDARR